MKPAEDYNSTESGASQTLTGPTSIRLLPGDGDLIASIAANEGISFGSVARQLLQEALLQRGGLTLADHKKLKADIAEAKDVLNREGELISRFTRALDEQARDGRAKIVHHALVAGAQREWPTAKTPAADLTRLGYREVLSTYRTRFSNYEHHGNSTLADSIPQSLATFTARDLTNLLVYGGTGGCAFIDMFTGLFKVASEQQPMPISRVAYSEHPAKTAIYLTREAVRAIGIPDDTQVWRGRTVVEIPPSPSATFLESPIIIIGPLDAVRLTFGRGAEVDMAVDAFSFGGEIQAHLVTTMASWLRVEVGGELALVEL